MSNSTARRTVSVILCFLLALAAISAALAVVIRFGITDEGTVRKALNESSYKARAYDALCSKITAEVTDVDMPESVADGVVDEKDFNKDISRAIDAAMKGRTVSCDGTAAAGALGKNIDAYFKKNKLGSSSALTAVKEQMTRDAGIYYQDQAAFDFGIYFKDLSRSTDRMSLIMLWGGIAAALLAAVLLLVITGAGARFMREISLSFLAAALASGGIAAAMMFTDVMGSTTGAPEYYRVFHDTFVRESAMPLILAAMTYLVVFIGLLAAAQKTDGGRDR